MNPMGGATKSTTGELVRKIVSSGCGSCRSAVADATRGWEDDANPVAAVYRRNHAVGWRFVVPNVQTSTPRASAVKHGNDQRVRCEKEGVVIIIVVVVAAWWIYNGVYLFGVIHCESIASLEF